MKCIADIKDIYHLTNNGLFDKNIMKGYSFWNVKELLNFIEQDSIIKSICLDWKLMWDWHYPMVKIEYRSGTVT